MDNTIFFALFVGALPTTAMLTTSLFGSSIDLSASFEAGSQNYCAGLILGAIAKELFPLLNAFPIEDSFVGISVGFFLGLSFLSSLDYIVGAIESFYEHQPPESPKQSTIEGEEKKGLLPYYQLNEGEDQQTDSPAKIGSASGEKDAMSMKSRDVIVDDKSDNDSVDSTDEDHALLQLAFQATSYPKHRDQIVQCFHDLVKFIQSIEEKSKKLMSCMEQIKPEHNPKPRNPSFVEVRNNTTKIMETCADEIDQEIHQLQYYLDNCRRQLQGAGSDIVGVVPRLTINEEQGQQMQSKLNDLSSSALKISAILQREILDKSAIKSVHRVIDQMDKQIEQLHETVEDYNFKWRKRNKITQRTPIPETGSYIPLGLLIPVVVDSMVDGFFMGSTCVISRRAGIVLALSNCLEMGFLGLAVSIRVKNCTGSSLFARMFALIFPPLIMVTFAFVGALVGSLSLLHPSLLVGFIAFGIVALLSLVINELLVEARETHQSWWSAIIFFLGVYSVIVLDRILPETDLTSPIEEMFPADIYL